ncbi:MAG: hypothetical protein ACYDAD_02625, partial [Acidimicrobiales bacterium]
QAAVALADHVRTGAPSHAAAARAAAIPRVDRSRGLYPWEASYWNAAATARAQLAGVDPTQAALELGQSRAELARAVSLVGEDYDVLNRYGSVLQQLAQVDPARRSGLLAESTRVLQRAVRANPWVAVSWALLSQGLRNRGDQAGALAAAEHGLRFQPRDVTLLSMAAEGRERAGDRAAALALWRRVLLVAPTDPTATAGVARLAPSR